MARKRNIEGIAAAEPVDAPDFFGADAGPDVFGRAPELPQPCPVTPLGVQGTKIFFLDSLNQICTSPPDCKKGELKLWFGNDWLETYFPQKDAKGNVVKFNQDHAQTALVEDCRAKGIFNPQGRVFGRGAHRARDDEEQLVLHMGRKVLLANARDRKGHVKAPEYVRPGQVGDSYFPALPGLPEPGAEAATTLEAQTLLKHLQNWRWVDRQAGPLLLLGHIAQMFICGALEWRAHVWLAAPTASGKSALQRLIRAIHADWCLATEDASEAALRQMLGDDTLPVMIDEAEAHDRPERLAQIMNLMKKSSSGAKMHRGSTDHKAQEFTGQSAFLLSSVLIASMRGEDRNRIAILELLGLPEDAEQLAENLPEWRKVGRRMHRRMVEQWPRFNATLNLYRREIGRRRFEGRWRDTYGTFLACADLLLYDDLPQDPIDAMHIEPGTGKERIANAVTMILPLMAVGKREARTDVERVQLHLLSHMLPGAPGKSPEPIGAWLDRAMSLKITPGQFATDEPDTTIDEEARRKLKSYGLRVVSLERNDKGGWRVDDARPEVWEGQYLAVAYQTNKALCEVFKGSEWADGGWLQSLGKIDGVQRGLKVRFSGKPDNALAVPLTALQGDEG